MADIRKEVLRFARSKIGERVWASRHAIDPITGTRGKRTIITGRRLGAVVQSEVCSSFKTDHSQDVVHFLRPNRRADETRFTKAMRARQKECEIGVGECWDLAYAAMDQFGGIKGKDGIKLTRGSHRKWSTALIPSLDAIIGGEILEMTPTIYHYKAVFDVNKNTIGAADNSMTGSTPHTAIVERYDKTKGIAQVVHQNAVVSQHRNPLVHRGPIHVHSAAYEEGSKKIAVMIDDQNRFPELIKTVKKEKLKIDKDLNNLNKDFEKLNKEYEKLNSNSRTTQKVWDEYSKKVDALNERKKKILERSKLWFENFKAQCLNSIKMPSSIQIYIPQGEKKAIAR